MKDKKEVQKSGEVRLRGVTVIATAIGAVAVGACAIGALAVQRRAIGRLVIGGAKFKSLDIQELTVTRLRIAEGQERSIEAGNGNGLIDIPSNHSVDATVEKLTGILQAKGVTLFARIDHSGEAEKAGLKMRPTRLLIFGNPKAGTPLMLASPRSAIDLPLKILIWEDAQGKVWVTYNNPVSLLERHSLPTELLQNINLIAIFAAQAAE